MKWKGKLINHFINELQDDLHWSNTVEKILIDPLIGIHLAIFNEPFLSLLLNGKKKIESRFSVNKITPFMRVAKGDLVFVQESGGMVVGVFIVGEVEYVQNVRSTTLKEIESNYADLICSAYDKDFWTFRKNSKYISLIEVKKVKRINPFKSEKNDRTGWSTIRTGIKDSLFG